MFQRSHILVWVLCLAGLFSGVSVVGTTRARYPDASSRRWKCGMMRLGNRYWSRRDRDAGSSLSRGALLAGRTAQ